ncbi:MAG TPA: hypothetical protein VL463_03100 [Kofleriaceae bacterium]|nr:hypothetical protein [Kofleriaceae bacterium]
MGVLGLGLAACSRKKPDADQGFQPDQVAAADPHGGALPPPPAVGPGALGDPQPGMGSMPPAEGEMPQDDVHAGLAARGGASPHAGGGGADVGGMGFQSPDPNRPIDKSKFLRGTIHPSDAMKAKIPPNALIYISVKKADPATGDAVPGMPIATEKLTAASWPLAFELTEANLMVAGGDFSGDIVVTARYAQNSDPLMKQSGDVTGHVRATIPADKLDVTLDTVLP